MELDAAAFAGDGSPACNTGTPSAPTIMQAQVDGGAPGSGVGGTVVDGTYYLTAGADDGCADDRCPRAARRQRIVCA